MATDRTSIPDFALNNPVYAGATVHFHTVDDDGEKTAILATLYDAQTGAGTLENPQILGSQGKFLVPVYVEEPVIAVITGLAHAEDHETGIIAGNLAGEAVTLSQAAAARALQQATIAQRRARDAALSASEAEQFAEDAQGAIGGVFVTVNDTTGAPLATKIVAGDGLTETVDNPGGNETLTLDVLIDAAAQIADGTITIAKLANGTDGEIPTWNSSGVAATVPAGTAGQVLTSNGAGAAPTFQDATGGTKEIILAVTSENGLVSAGTGKFTFRMPYAATLTAVRAGVKTAAATGTLTVDINEAGTTVLSTKLTIDATEKTSTTAASAAVISDSALADDAEITVDVDNAANGLAVGLKVTLFVTPT